MLFSLGIMQGRLSPKEPARLQSFPWDSWLDEFERARAIGFHAIEWLVDGDRDEENPLWSAAGRRRIQAATAATGILVPTMCAHCFIDGRLGHPKAAVRAIASERLAGLMERGRDVGITIVVIPAMDAASLKNAAVRARTLDTLTAVLARTTNLGVRLALESDLPAADLAGLINAVSTSSALGVCYDVGNATSFGYDAAAELVQLGARVAEIHIKDRRRGGGSVMLGEGDTPFAAVADTLRRLDWSGPVVLETPVGDDWEAAAMVHHRFTRDRLNLEASPP